MLFILKVVLSAFIIVLIAEISKRSQVLGAILASIPLVSVLALIWFYLGGATTQEVAVLSRGIFWMVLPSLVFFLAFPILLHRGLNFFVSLVIALVVMVACYFIMVLILKGFSIKI